MAHAEQVAARSPHIVLEIINLADAERQLAQAALTATGSIVEAAQLLGVTRQYLKRLIIKHRIEWPRGYKPGTETPCP
jgi:excisionase family DNA binding protein